MFETRQWGWFVLLTSTTTLVCCALPIVLVSLGFGAVWATMFANLPFLGLIARSEDWAFASSGTLLALAAYALFRPGRTCPTDPVLAAKCDAAHYWNIRLFWTSTVVWCVGFTAAYLALPLQSLL